MPARINIEPDPGAVEHVERRPERIKHMLDRPNTRRCPSRVPSWHVLPSYYVSAQLRLPVQAIVPPQPGNKTPTPTAKIVQVGETPAPTFGQSRHFSTAQTTKAAP